MLLCLSLGVKQRRCRSAGMVLMEVVVMLLVMRWKTEDGTGGSKNIRDVVRQIASGSWMTVSRPKSASMPCMVSPTGRPEDILKLAGRL